jgi:hypothetical protein
VQRPVQPDVVFGHATRRKALVKPATNGFAIQLQTSN